MTYDGFWEFKLFPCLKAVPTVERCSNPWFAKGELETDAKTENPVGEHMDEISRIHRTHEFRYAPMVRPGEEDVSIIRTAFEELTSKLKVPNVTANTNT